MTERYNGWASYETWQAALWLSEVDFLGYLQDGDAESVDAEDVQGFITEVMLEDANWNGLQGDILSAWLSCVNFHEIADTYNQDLGGDRDAA